MTSVLCRIEQANSQSLSWDCHVSFTDRAVSVALSKSAVLEDTWCWKVYYSFFFFFFFRKIYMKLRFWNFFFNFFSIERVIHYDQVGSTLGIWEWVNRQNSINLICHLNRMKESNQDHLNWSNRIIRQKGILFLFVLNPSIISQTNDRKYKSMDRNSLKDTGTWERLREPHRGTERIIDWNTLLVLIQIDFRLTWKSSVKGELAWKTKNLSSQCFQNEPQAGTSLREVDFMSLNTSSQAPKPLGSWFSWVW